LALSGATPLTDNGIITLNGTAPNGTVESNLTFNGSTLNVIGDNIVRAAATQDGVRLAGRAGGTGNFHVTITPTTLTGNRILTLADGNTTLVVGTMVNTNRTLTINGTANQVISSLAGVQSLAADRTWTLSLPQNIHTAATPTFSDVLLGTNLSVARRFATTIGGISNAGYTNICNVTGNSLASGIKISLQGTTGSVVVNVIANIIVNHFQDIYIKSESGIYTVLTLRVISDNNENFTIQATTDSANAVTLNVEVFPLNSETVVFSATALTGTTLTHVCSPGMVISATGGSDGNLRLVGNLVAAQVDTGQGLTEVHLMNQNIRTTDSPTFVRKRLNGTPTVWSATTPGTGIGDLHIGQGSGTSNAGFAMTFGARDASAGNNGQAGIYINSDGSYGTRMYIATTDSYATGARTAISINEGGAVSIIRSGLTLSADSTTISFSSVTGAKTISTGGSTDLALSPGGNVRVKTAGLTGGGALQVGGDVRASGEVFAFSSSDKQLKDNITLITNPIEKIMKIGGYTFDWNDKQTFNSGKDYGVIAQEIEEIMPELVNVNHNGFKAVRYEKITPLLIEAIKEQNSMIKNQKERIDKLEEVIQQILNK
jgi:hypothetical protein